MRSLLATALLTAACGQPSGSLTEPQEGVGATSPAVTTEAAQHFVLDHARMPGGTPVAIEIRDGRIAGVWPEPPDGLPRIDLEDRYVAPAFIDSHVHLAFRFGVDAVNRGVTELAREGVIGGVDLAAPSSTLPAFAEAEHWLAAGPMVTPLMGYPTQSWGAGGYGREVGGIAAIESAIDDLVDAGIDVVKVPIEGSLVFTAQELEAVVSHAHGHGLLVAVHALGDAEAMMAAEAGADLLAHTPADALSESTIAAWADRGVVSTLAAFGGGRIALENLRRLHDAGATVLYGTDLGNATYVGINPDEVALLLEAGLSPAEILDAGTRTPAQWWGMDSLGALAPGRAASLLVLDVDPLEDPSTLSEPAAVYADGVLVAGA